MDSDPKTCPEIKEPISPILSTDLSYIYGENYLNKSHDTQNHTRQSSVQLPLGPSTSYFETPRNEDRFKQSYNYSFNVLPSASTSSKQQLCSSFAESTSRLQSTAERVNPYVGRAPMSSSRTFFPPSSSGFPGFLVNSVRRTGPSTSSGIDLNSLRVKRTDESTPQRCMTSPEPTFPPSCNAQPAESDNSVPEDQPHYPATQRQLPWKEVDLGSLRLKLDFGKATACCDDSPCPAEDLMDEVVIAGSIDAVHPQVSAAENIHDKENTPWALPAQSYTRQTFDARTKTISPEKEIVSAATSGLAFVEQATAFASDRPKPSAATPRNTRPPEAAMRAPSPLSSHGGHDLRKVLTVNDHRYLVMKIIGEGGSCKVYEVYNAKKQLRAIKVVKLSNEDRDTSMTYLNEIALLKKLQFSNRVIKLFDYEHNVEHRKLYVVLERGDVDLGTLIRSTDKRGQITDAMVKFYWSEMLRAVQVIHQEGIIHSDLKPANFLIVEGQLKIIDFGISSSIPDDVTSIIKEIATGTPSYMSPEALKNTGVEEGQTRIKIGVKSDVWSLGCILYHIVHRRTPFSHIRHSYKLFDAIANPKHPINFPPVADPLLDDVLKKCIVRDPKQRSSISQLLIHPYLTGIPNKNVESLVLQISELSPNSMRKISQVVNQMSNSKSN